MSGTFYLDLVRNGALLLLAYLIHDLLGLQRVLTGSRARSALAGLAVGGLGIGIMVTAVPLEEGIVFDTRSVLLGISGLFFGTVPTLIGTTLVSGYRYFAMGGIGAWPGIGVSVASGAIGLLWRWRRGGVETSVRMGELYLLGLTLHGAMLLILLNLYGEDGVRIISRIIVPILLIYPLVTVLLGRLLNLQIERRQEAEALLESEGRYRSLFDSDHAIMLLVDPSNGQIVEANPAAEQFYGWPLGVLETMRITEVNTLPEGEVMATLDRARSGENASLSFHHRRADGSVREVAGSCGLTRIGRRELLHCIITDLTDRRAVDRSLAIQAAALRATANTIMIMDPAGIVEWINPACSAVTQVTEEEAVGRSAWELAGLVGDARARESFRELERTVRGGRVWQGEVTSTGMEGLVSRQRATVTPILEADGTLTHIIAVGQDITREEELARELHATQKLEAIGRLAGGIAHDFNNLLTVVNGTLDLILRELPPDSPLRRELIEVREAGARGSRLTRQLLQFSRRQVREVQFIDLPGGVKSVMGLIRKLLPEDIELRLDLEAEVPPLEIDLSQLEQVLMNLCVNARDAMPDGGGILTVSTERHDLVAGDPLLDPELTPGSYHLIRVSDTGIGIPPEHLNHLFEPFFTTKADSGGTGLGLSTSHGIVTQAGGGIRVTSVVGEGSTFLLLLPADRSAPRAAPRVEHGGSPEVEAGESGSGERPRVTPRAMVNRPAGTTPSGVALILLVEDQDAVRRVAPRLLERLGYRVIAAASGAEALALLSAAPGTVPDLLFSDVVMPGMSGPALVGELQERGIDIPVLFASGYTNDALLAHGLRDDHHYFIEKPYSIEGLAARLREILTSSAH